MKRIPLLFSLILASLLPAQPNIVVVMADDLGPGDIAFYHEQRTETEAIIPTPNMDRLIEEGMHFTRAHSPAPLCAPSRFSMLTGNYPYRSDSPFGAWTSFNRTGIDPNFTTSARIAKAAHYRTAFFGKWGTGGQMYVKGTGQIKKGWGSADIDFTRRAKGPNEYGFDDACELPQGIQGEPFAYYENGQWMPLQRDSKLVPVSPQQSMYDISRKHKDLVGLGDSNWDPRQAGEILTSKAIDFISDHKASHPDQPFFVYFCSQAVHIPHTPPDTLNGVEIAGTTPGVHGDMIREFDVQVGMLRDALKAHGYDKNTLFILTSDNGGLMADPAMIAAGHDSTGGLRSIKGSIHEGGHRIPFVAVWPGVIAPQTESDALIVGHDVVATIASVSGQEIDRTKVKDSVDLLPFFTQSKDPKGRAFLLQQSTAGKGANYSIQEGDWKLIMNAPTRNNLKVLKPIALFNLATNPSEDQKLNQLKNPEAASIAKKLFKTFSEFRKTGANTVED